jgi:hypothetical protein
VRTPPWRKTGPPSKGVAWGQYSSVTFSES